MLSHDGEHDVLAVARSGSVSGVLEGPAERSRRRQQVLRDWLVLKGRLGLRHGAGGRAVNTLRPLNRGPGLADHGAASAAVTARLRTRAAGWHCPAFYFAVHLQSSKGSSRCAPRYTRRSAAPGAGMRAAYMGLP